MSNQREFDFLGFNKVDEGGFILDEQQNNQPFGSSFGFGSSSSAKGTGGYSGSGNPLIPLKLRMLVAAYEDNPHASELTVPYPMGSQTVVNRFQAVGYVYDFENKEDEMSVKCEFMLCDGTSALKVYWHIGQVGSLSRYRELELEKMYKKMANRTIYLKVVGELDLRGMLSAVPAIRAARVSDISNDLDLIMFHDVECMNFVTGGKITPADPNSQAKMNRFREESIPSVTSTPLRTQPSQQRRTSQQMELSTDYDKAENSVNRTQLRSSHPYKSTSLKHLEIKDWITKLLTEFGGDRPDGMNVREINKVMNSRTGTVTTLDAIRQAMSELDDEGFVFSMKGKDYWSSST